MKKIILGAIVALSLASCSTMFPVAGATGMVGSKTGEASQGVLFYAFPFSGKGGVAEAAKAGGITKVGTVDFKISWPLSPIIPYIVKTTVVTGE